MDIPSMELDNGKGMDSDRFEWFFGWCIILCAIQHDLHIMNIYIYIRSYISNIYISIHYICPWSIWKNLLWQVSSPQWKSDGSHRKETHPAILLVTGKDTEKSNKNIKGKNLWKPHGIYDLQSLPKFSRKSKQKWCKRWRPVPPALWMASWVLLMFMA